MKNVKLLCSVVLVAGMMLSQTAMADRGHGYGGRGHSHVGVGLYIGGPYLYPYYPPYPYGYYPPVK